jgi:ligand-binding sensor domain-containing protein/AraC-like DNA-binding protein
MVAINRCIIIVVWFVLLSATASRAQNIYLKFNHLNVNNGLPQNSVYSIVEDKYGFMWFATWGGAVRYDGYSLRVFRAQDNDTSALSDNRINAIVLDGAQNIWIQTGEPRYVYLYNYDYENFTRVLLSQAPLVVKYKLKHWKADAYPMMQNTRYIWYSNHQNLLQTDRKSGQSIEYIANENYPFSLSDNIVNYMYLDKSENLWIGTQNGGVNHANLNIKPFLYYNSDPQGIGLIENVVRAVCSDKKGQLWIGSENKGITVLDRMTKRKKYITLSKTEHTQRIRSLCCDHQGQMWVGTKGGLYNVNPQTNIVTNCSEGLESTEIFALFEDHENVLWVGSFNGLARYDKVANKCIVYGSSLTGGTQIRSIIEDHKQNLWIATEEGGVARLKRAPAGMVKSAIFVHKDGDENSLINNRTFSLAEDNDGMIWIATNSGLSRLNPSNNSFKHFTLRNGLPDDIIMGVLFDGRKSVWISHKKGLSRINTHTFELQNFNIYDGVQGNEFSQNACFREKQTGEMFFGGTNGLNSFFPDSFKVNHIPPRMVFTQLRIMDQVILPGIRYNDRLILEKSLLSTYELTLTWWDKTFSVEFAALHFANPLANKYKYKLEGYDKQWIYSNATSRKASYSHIPAGTYVLKVYGANNDGVWCETPATLRIKILPPWWQSWWTKIIACVLLLVVIVTVYKIRIARKRMNLLVQQLTNRKTDEPTLEKIETTGQNSQKEEQQPLPKSQVIEIKEMTINISDEAFLKKVTKLVEENLEDENFDIDTLAEKLKMSRSQFYRKIKALTNKSLIDFVSTLRMKKALEYLLSGEYNISETAYKVGYSQSNNFSRTFTKHFGVSPSKYIENLKKNN